MEFKEAAIFIILGVIIGWAGGFSLGMYFYWQAIKPSQPTPLSGKEK